MLKDKKALLLIGSPKKKNSASEVLGNYLLEGLNKKGYTTEKLHISSILKNNLEKLFDMVKDTDLLIISFPLYVDSLPSPLIRAFELIADHRKANKTDREQSLMAIVNCGFPEAFHNDTALRICRSFANESNFKWLGGLAMGAGPAINGRPVKKTGMTRNIVKALDAATEAIANHDPIPSEAAEMMSNKFMPEWLYTLIGNQSWKIQAKQYNAHRDLYAKPYLNNFYTKLFEAGENEK